MGNYGQNYGLNFDWADEDANQYGQNYGLNFDVDPLEAMNMVRHTIGGDSIVCRVLSGDSQIGGE